MSNKKLNLLSIIYVGHVDAGKSTLQGQLFYQLGLVRPHILDKLRREAAEMGKASFEFAWLLDQLKEERERGVTVALTYNEITTDTHRINLIDAPGHRDYLKNMITGASQSDGAVLVVDANTAKIQAQTRMHFQILAAFGVRNFIVAINKMDEVNYSQQRFNEVQELVNNQIFKKYGIPPACYIPISGFRGDNVISHSENTPWYQGQSLLQAIQEIPAPQSQEEKPLRIPISGTYQVKGTGQVFAGRVYSGVLNLNDQVNLVSGSNSSVVEVKGIQTHHRAISSAGPGENIGISLKGSKVHEVKRGAMIGTSDLVAGTRFRVQFDTLAPEKRVVMELLGITDESFTPKPFSIKAGYSPVMNYHAGQVPCTISEIISINNKPVGEVPIIGNRSRAQAIIETNEPILLESPEFRGLSRFILRDMNQVVAIGFCLEKIS